MNPTEINIKTCPLASLKLDPKNPRQHSETQIKQIVRSIQSFGFNVPVLVDGNKKIIAGHGRVLAAQKLGLKEVPVVCLGHLSSAQAKAFAIADNRLTENSSWDPDLLGEIFQDLSLQDLDFSLEATGFLLDEIELHIEGLTPETTRDADDVFHGALSEQTVSKVGDLWCLGPHRVLCGDATKKEDVLHVMNGQKASMTFTDAPYNVNYASSLKDKLRGKDRPILNDNLGDQFYDFLLAACRNIVQVTDGAIYLCMSSSELHTLQKAFAEAGGHWSTFIIWAKQAFTLGRADYQRQYEPILYGWSEGSPHHWCGARDQGDVWFFDKPPKNDLHPTMKPISLVMRTLRNSSQRGDVVFDPFLGSGTTLIAAERTGRVCHGLELDPKYVDVIIRRWQEHTGEKALHAETGKLFRLLEEGGSYVS